LKGEFKTSPAVFLNACEKWITEHKTFTYRRNGEVIERVNGRYNDVTTHSAN
jgi:hypothetical protein